MLRRAEGISTRVVDACTRRKPIDVSGDTDTKLKRCLTTFDLTFLGIGSTLGAGIYILTGEVAKDKAGPAVVISFLIAAAASILSGFSYAELGARFPKAGSAYVYCYVAIGEFCAFFIGWTVLLEYIIGVSTIAKGASNYIDSISKGAISNGTIELLGEMNVTGLNNYVDLLAVAIVFLFTAILCLGVKVSSRVNTLFVLVNTITILVVTIASFINADSANWTNFAPYGFTGILRGASTCFFAFIGFDLIATTCEEAKNPGKSVPLSILGTIVFCLLAYVGVSASLTLMVPYYELDAKASLTVAFAQRHLNVLVYIVAMGATTSLLGCTLVASIGPSRLLYAMSTDGLIPGVFANVNSKTSVPLFGTVSSGILVALLAAILDLKSLTEMMSIGTLLAYSIVDISVLVLRYRQPIELENIEELEEAYVSTEAETINYAKRRLLELQNSPTFINTVIFVLVLEIFCASVVAAIFPNKLFVERDPFCIVVFTFLLLFVLCSAMFLFSLKENTEGLAFSVPLVPWTPIAALAINFCLMLELPSLTWIRLLVWTAVGFVVYFAYSMHHSVERNNNNTLEEMRYSLIDEDKDNEMHDGTCEKTSLLSTPSKVDNSEKD